MVDPQAFQQQSAGSGTADAAGSARTRVEPWTPAEPADPGIWVRARTAFTPVVVSAALLVLPVGGRDRLLLEAGEPSAARTASLDPGVNRGASVAVTEYLNFSDDVVSDLDDPLPLPPPRTWQMGPMKYEGRTVPYLPLED